MDAYDYCKKCTRRVGCHSIYESVECKLIKKNDLKDIRLTHEEIWGLLRGKLIKKDTAIQMFEKL